MTKIIVKIRKNSKDSITAVKLDNGKEESLQEVVKNLKAGESYKTSTGGTVELTFDKEHITTINDGTENNNLESLPTF